MSDLNFGFTGSSSSLKDFSTKLGQWWYIFAAAVGSAIVSVSASFAGSYDICNNWQSTSGVADFALFVLFMPWAWLLLGSLMIIYGGKGTYIDQKNLNSRNEELKEEIKNVDQLKEQINSVSEDSELLQNELAELQVKLVTTWLKGSARQLNLGTHCRATIYYYINEKFYLIARYSQNPKYAEIHRLTFPRNKGVISQAWEHGVCIDIENIPVFYEDKQEYIEYMKEHYGYEHDKIEKLTMKSCQYIAISVVEADKHIGVIVFESDKKSLWKEQKVAQIKRYCSDYQSYMVDFIHGAIKYDKTLKVTPIAEHDVDDEFVSTFRRKS